MLQKVKRVQPGDWRSSSKDLKTIKDEIDDWLYDEVNGVVQSGPFEGTVLLRDTIWKDAHLAPLLLGCYEEELHGEFERQINRLKRLEKPVIGVIGSAEGYYAIGLKRRIPHAEVYAVEPDERAKDICEQTARVNNVTIHRDPVIDWLIPRSDFLVVDCEGNEIHYMDPLRYARCRDVNAIVEVHNFAATPTQKEIKTDEILLDRFRGTHRITLIMEGPRNPNKFKQLCSMVSDYRWAAVSEGRPCQMGWFVMEPKGVAVS